MSPTLHPSLLHFATNSSIQTRKKLLGKGRICILFATIKLKLITSSKTISFCSTFCASVNGSLYIYIFQLFFSESEKTVVKSMLHCLYVHVSWTLESNMNAYYSQFICSISMRQGEYEQLNAKHLIQNAIALIFI